MFRSIKSVLFSLLLVVAFTSCEKEMSLENGNDFNTGGTQSGTAIFTLDGAPLNCPTPLISGDYVVGTPMDAGNSVVITVSVATVGTYTIATGLINGIQFTGSGTFPGTGPQPVTLFASGTPTAAVTSSYSPGINGCTFLITSTTAAVTPASFIKTKIDGVQHTFYYQPSASQDVNELKLMGRASSTSFESLELDLLGSSTPPPAVYEAEGVTPGATIYAEAIYIESDLTPWILDMNSPVTRPHPFKITVTTISATRITGTFEGGIFLVGGSTEKVFTEGSFDLPIQ